MRKDIQNRSVYYSDRESPDTSDRSYDLIVRDNDPVTFNRVANKVSLDDRGATANGANIIHTNAQMLNNVRLNLDSQQYQQQSANNGARVKNVNISNIQNAAHCETKDNSTANDINVFSFEDKSNLNQRYQPKVLKQDR